MRERFRNWMRTPSLRGQLIWLSVSSVLVTLLISLLILVLLISNVMGPFVNREAEFAMQTVSRSLSTKTQLLEDILLRICKSPQMTGEASDARGEQFRSLVDIYSDKNIVAPGLPFVEMAYFMDMRGSFDVVSYHEQLSSEQLRLNEDNLARYRAFQESGTDVQCTASEPYLYIIFTVYDRWADPFGTVIFVVNQSAVTSIMGKLSDYQDAFWYLFDKDGAVVLSEFGGYNLPVAGHTWNAKNFGYKGYQTPEALGEAVKTLYETQIVPACKSGLAADVYTQLSDVEDEVNGFVTYDRRVEKLPEALMRAIARELKGD